MGTERFKKLERLRSILGSKMFLFVYRLWLKIYGAYLAIGLKLHLWWNWNILRRNPVTGARRSIR